MSVAPAVTSARQRWIDVALCAAVTAVVQAVIWVGRPLPGPVVVNAAFGVAMTAPLLLRRRLPVPMLAAVVCAVAVQALAYGGTETAAVLLPYIVVVYGAAVYGTPAYVVVALSLLGIVLHDARDPLVTSPSQAWFSPIVVSAVLLVGRIVHLRRRQAADAEARAVRAEQDRQHAVQEAVSAEQRRIGRELHDVVAHSISVMALQAGAAEQVLRRSPEQVATALRLIRETGHEAVREMGRLLCLESDGTGEPPDPPPSMNQLPALLDRVRKAGLDAQLVVEGEVRPLPAGLELTLFRIAQEGLTNALKHAPLGRTKVGYCYGVDQVIVDVTTQGPTSSTGGGSGLGLAGLSERVAFAGGRLDAGPADDGGWRLRAVLPIAT
ncbi:MAG: sensor histidine kinase [Mycobacteriales bacterium]